MGSDEGASTIQAIVVLCLACAILAAAAQAVASYTRIVRVRSDTTRDSAMIGTAVGIASGIQDDATPSADSPHDAAFSLAEAAGATIADASSAINPNWIRKQPLEQTELARLLASGVDAQALQQSRVDEGLSVDIERRYAAFFKEESFDRMLCGYSYANVNSGDEFALERLFLEATGDASAAASFHAAIRSALADRRQFSPSDLAILFGSHAGSAGAVMTVEPQINVNFVDPFVLKALLSYPAYKIEAPVAGADAIIGARASGELTIQRAAAILGIATDHPLFTYLGDDTWFWRVTVKADGRGLEAIFARPLPVPGEPLPGDTEKRPILIAWELVDA